MKLVNMGKDTGMLRFLAKDFRFRTKRYLLLSDLPPSRGGRWPPAAAIEGSRRPPAKRIDIIYRTKPKMIQAYVTTLQQQGTIDIEFHIDLLQHTSEKNLLKSKSITL